MAIKISADLITVSSSLITVRSETTGYDRGNVNDVWHTKRRFRAAAIHNAPKWPLMSFDMGSHQTVNAVYLADVNFDTIKIVGSCSARSTDWSGSTYSTTNITVMQNKWTGRYQIWIDTTGFDYRHLGLIVNTSNVVSGSATAWEVGSIAIMDGVTEFAENPMFGIEQETVQPYKDVGITGRVSLGEPRWQGKLPFGVMTTDEQESAQIFNQIDMGSPLVYYENNGNTAHAYICRKNRNYSGKIITNNLVSGSIIELEELVSE